MTVDVICVCVCVWFLKCTVLCFFLLLQKLLMCGTSCRCSLFNLISCTVLVICGNRKPACFIMLFLFSLQLSFSSIFLVDCRMNGSQADHSMTTHTLCIPVKENATISFFRHEISFLVLILFMCFV